MWAGGNFDPSSLPPQMIQTLMNPTYCAQLTGHASSTGGGKVYVNAPQAGQSASEDPRDNDYVEGESNVAVSGMGMSMAGMTKIGINAWAKADPGYWFAGFSYSNMGVDLGTTTDENMPGLYANTYDIGIQENETIEHVIYGTFEPIRIAGYEISGNATTASDGEGNMVCNLAVIFTLSGAEVDIDASDFKAPVVSGEGWSMTSWDYNTTNAGKVTANVRFTTTSTDVAEYTGSLKLETQATPAISMNVTLNARTAASSEIEAIRYNKNKVKQGEGSLSAMIAAAAPTDVIKLNKNHNSEVIVNRSFTLDLNGYNLQVLANTAITVGDNATLTLAFSPYGGQIQGFQQQGILVKSGSKAILKGGTIVNNNIGVKVEEGAELELDGAMVAGNTNAAIDNAGKVTTTDGVIVGLVKTSGEFVANGGSFRNINETVSGMQHVGGPAILIEDGNVQIKKGTITGETYGVQTNGGSTTIEKLAVISGGAKALNGAGGTLTVNNGKFTDPDDLSTGSISFNAGYFQRNNSGATEVFEKSVWRNTSGAEFRDGYEFFVGSDEAAKEAGVSVCHIGGTSYSTLEDALAYANNTSEPVVIIMDNDYILPAGYYTIPNNATLLIPKSNEQGAATPIVNYELSYTAPSLFRKLTLASGVNLDVFGTIEVSGTQYSGNSNQAEGTHTGAVIGDYAQLQMNKGSKITLQNNSVLRAWGYVTGDIENKDKNHNVPAGEIDVRRGANVYEFFQMGDWGETVMNGLGLVSGDTRFPITSYFIQNVEVPAKYHPGGRLTSVTTVSASGAGLNLTMCANEIQIIGVTGVAPAMFLMNQEADAENTWVRKWYDASKDQQVYEINSGAHIGNLVINLASSPLFEGLESTLAGMGGTFGTIGNLAQNMGAEFHQDLILNSGQYVLPITSNFKLHLMSGTLDFTQSTELIPGSELEIDKEAIVYVTDQGNEDVLEGSLYIYDYRDWVSDAAADQPAQKILYTPSFDDGENNGVVPDAVRDVSTCEALGHAKVNVHGTFDTYQGYIFTSEHGGDIFSSVEDAGTFMFTSPALLNEEGNDSIEVVKLTTSFGGGGQTVNFYPAKLHNSAAFVANGGEEYQSTGGTKEGQSYCYIDMGNGGEWTSLEQRGCFTYNDADETYYIKSQEYVPVVVNSNWNSVNEDFDNYPIGNSDYTFSDAAGAGRLFINLEGGLASECQWWEVEKKDNYYHCIHPANDTYYYWDETDEIWKEVKFTITWKDKDWENNPTEDVVLQSYTVPYGTQAEWLSNSPTRPSNIDYTYDFTGWSPALGKVTSDVTYTATYEAKQIKYTITFVQDGGVEIEKHLLARNEFPVCENVPTRTGYILEWYPALAAVTGNQTYTATWLPEPPEKYEIKFLDYDGTELDRDSVEVGTLPTPPANPSGKPATSEFTYVFDHWSPALEEVSATSAKVYTAVYREVARNYTVSYYRENGTTLISSEQLPYGATPTPPAVSKENPEDGYSYTLVWKTLDESGTIQTVTGNASYKATFDGVPNKYAVTVKSNPSGACTFMGAGIFEYGTTVNNVAVSYDEEQYEFLGWSDLSGDAKTASTHASFTLTKDTTIVADFRYTGDDKVTITWKNWNGGDLGTSEPKVNAATTFIGATPTREASESRTYTFYGWYTKNNEGDTLNIYKNGMTPKATAPATYYAFFTEKTREYTIYWRNENGTDIEVDHNQPYGAATSFSSALPTKQATAAATYTFDGWSTELNGDLAYPYGETPNVEADAYYYAHFDEARKTYTITWKRDDGSLIENTEEEYGAELSPADPTKPETAEYTYEFDHWTPALANVTGVAIYTAVFNAIPKVNDLEVDVNESEDLAGETTVRNNLIISSTGVASGQLLGAENLSITGEAIFRLEQSFEAQTWYAVAVPWEVDPNTGIYNAARVHLPTGNVYVIEFDANAYASADRQNGRADYWQFLDVTGNNMMPGKLYMVYLSAPTEALEFHKMDGASIWTTSTTVAPASGSISSQSNWNAISNPALYHADMVTGATDGDVLKYNGDNSYIVASSTNMVVGQPIFAQVAASSTVYATVHSGASPAPAYRRAAEAATDANNRFVVELSMDDKLADRLIVQTAEEKADEYVIGKDIAKMSVSSKVAQMWINRYDAKLCKNTVAFRGEQVEYPLTISAPKAGEYTLHNTHYTSDSDYTLYLTYNGEAIWNLSESDFVLTLEQGTDARYGLRVSAKAPQVATGVDEAVVDAKGETKKVIINDKVFIIRGEQVYSIDGRLAK